MLIRRFVRNMDGMAQRTYVATKGAIGIHMRMVCVNPITIGQYRSATNHGHMLGGSCEDSYWDGRVIANK